MKTGSIYSLVIFITCIATSLLAATDGTASIQSTRRKIAEIHESKTDAEFLEKYFQFLSDMHVSALLSKGDVTPLGKGVSLEESDGAVVVIDGKGEPRKVGVDGWVAIIDAEGEISTFQGAHVVLIRIDDELAVVDRRRKAASWISLKKDKK